LVLDEAYIVKFDDVWLGLAAKSGDLVHSAVVVAPGLLILGFGVLLDTDGAGANCISRTSSSSRC
jgi:hypothetical protein